MTAKPHYTIRPAVLADAAALRLREADARELAAMGLPAVPTLAAAVAQSYEAWAAVDRRGRPMALWGLTTSSFVSRDASLWLFTGRQVVKLQWSFVSHARKYIDNCRRRFSTLDIFVHDEYKQACRLYRLLGFKDYAAVDLNGNTFLRMRQYGY